MITDSKTVRDFEDGFIRESKIDYTLNFRIADAMYREAVALKVFPPADPLEGIEVDIKIARIINNV